MDIRVLFSRKFGLIIAGTIALAVLMLAFSFVEIRESRRELLLSLESEAQTIIEMLIRSSETTLLANTEIEELLVKQLASVAAFVSTAERQMPLDSVYLQDVARLYEVGFIGIAAASGEITASNLGFPERKLPEAMLQNARPVAEGDYVWLVIGVAALRKDGEPFFLVAHERYRGAGFIVVGLRTSALADTRKRIGIGKQIQDIGDNPDIAYIVVQDEAGILIATRGVKTMEPIADDAFLKGAFQSKRALTRTTEYNGRTIFEAVKTLKFEDGSRSLARLGLTLDLVDRIENRSSTRTLLIAFGVVAVGALVFGFVLTRERFALLREEHRKAQTYTGLVLENMADGVIAADMNGRVTVCNQAAALVTGMREDDVVNGALHRIFPGDPFLLEQTLSSKVPVSYRERQYTRPSGEQAILGVGTSLIFDSGGKPDTAVAIIRDLSIEKQTQEKLKRQEKLTAMGELAGSVAHEIRNPLNAISIIVQRFQVEFEPKEDAEEYHKLAATVRAEVRRVNTIIKQFLDFTRPPKLRPQKTDVSALMQETIEIVRSQALMKGVGIETDFAPDAFAEVDPDRMKQVFLNLLQNAIDAVDEKGKVRCSVEADQAAIRATVSDDGPGIPPDIQSRIFNLYFTTKAQGTGLGLSIVHQIMQDHNGEIQVASEKGKGASFTATLPRMAE